MFRPLSAFTPATLAATSMAALTLTLAACAPAASPTNQGSPSTAQSADQPLAQTTTQTGAEGFVRNDYTQMQNWLCHPGKTQQNACDIDLTATAVAADGSTTIIPFAPAPDPAFDCFYIYPTVSFDTTWNSDMNPGPEELNVVANQFARYASTCRLYAPIYRQRTLLELRSFMMTGESKADVAMRYADVKDSWDTYMRDHNEGRGVVLIGHSQGAGMIFDLLEADLLGSAQADRLIGVHAIGFTATLDPERGGFLGMPVCETASQTGCMINYESFRAGPPPPETSRFGMAGQTGRAICTNPAQLSGNDGALDAYMPARGLAQPAPYDYGVPVDTPFVKLPGLLSARCETNDTHDWLSITIHGDPGDPRADDISGDVIVAGQVLADWGLHLVDMNIAMGDLVDLARSQGEAWLAQGSGEPRP